MFKLTIHDRNGVELNEGDLVVVSSSDRFSFFAEVKWLEDERAISPFHTFSFHSFEKIDKIPEGAVLSEETRYKLYYLPEPEEDLSADQYKNYLMSWRECEDLIDRRCWRIERLKKINPQLSFI